MCASLVYALQLVLMEDNKTKVDRDGELQTPKDASLKKWSKRRAVLTGGALYTFKKKAKQQEIHLRGYQVIEAVDAPVVSPKKDPIIDNAFVLRKSDKSGPDIIFSAKSAQDKTDWIAALRGNIEKPPGPLPDLAKSKGAMYSIESNLAGSKLGKKIIKEVAHEDAWVILDGLCAVIAKVLGEEEAATFKKGILKVGTKLAILHKNKIIDSTVLSAPRKLIIHLCSLVSDYYQMPSLADAGLFIEDLKSLRGLLEPVLSSKLSEKNMQAFQEVFRIGTNRVLIEDLFAKKKHQELGEISAILKKHMGNFHSK